MRVALVVGRYAPALDGVSDYVARLAAGLRGAGVDAVVAAAGAGPSRSSAPAAAGRAQDEVPVVRLAERPDAGGTVAAAGALRRLRPDLVHVHFAPSAYGFRPWVGLLPRLGVGAPVVTTLHEYGWWTAAPLPPPAWRTLERRGWLDREALCLPTRSRALLVSGPGTAEVLAARLGRVARVVPVPSNVDLPQDEPTRRRLREQGRALRGLPPDATVLVVFGFVHPVKGVRYLLEAVAALRAEGRDVRLVVAGGFESLALPDDEARAFEAELRGLVTALGLDAVVEVTGFLPEQEAAQVLLAADAAVLPFTAGVTAKSGSLVAVLAAGLPAVLTRADPSDPALVDGVTAVLVDRVRDAPALADGVRRVLDDPGLAARLADGGRRLAARRGWPEVVARHLDVYRSVLAGTGRG